MSELAAALPNTAATSSAAHAERASYYPWFDWLRIALALVVVLSHEGLLPIWPHAGNFAVQVFFALSGWLIGRILLDTAPAELPRFYFNRAVRIWAPYFLALGLLVVASLLKEPFTAKRAEFVVYKLLFVYNLFGPPQLAAHRQDMPLDGTGNHFWSVNAEEQFYLLAPLFLVLAARWGRSLPLWIAIGFAAWLANQYSSIAFGVIAVLATHGDERRLERPLVRPALVAVLAACAVGVGAGFSYPLLAPPAALCIVLLLAAPGPRRPIGAFFGGVSYPLYLNHWIGVFIANALLQPFGARDTPLRHVLSIVCGIALASVLYWQVDRRLLARRGALYSPTIGRAAVVVAYCMVALGLAYGLAVAARAS